MTKRDIEMFLHFITKTEMFIHQVKPGYILAFVDGYEIGRNGKCNFSNELSEMLEKELMYKKRAMGWNGQLIEYSKKHNLSWSSSFKKIGLKLLSKHFQGKHKNKYLNIFKEAIQLKISQIKLVKFKNQDTVINNFGSNWIRNWTDLVYLNEQWFKAIWTKKELKIIAKITKEIGKIENKERFQIIANKELIQLAEKFKMN